MVKIVFLFLLSLLFLKPVHGFTDSTSVRLLQIYEDYNKSDKASLPDLLVKEEKISRCIEGYKKSPKSYTRSAHTTIYHLLYDKKVSDLVSYEEKFLEFARFQCRIYYKIGVIK
jgi:hypothetical protein